MKKLIALLAILSFLSGPAWASVGIQRDGVQQGQATDINFTGGITTSGSSTIVVGVGTPTITGGTINGAVIGGVTPAAGTFTTLTATTSITDSGLTASRAVATDASKVLVSTFASAALTGSLSDETGTGVAVFATSPALVTPVVGNGDTSAGATLYKEDSDNGTNAVTVIGPASTADVTQTLAAVAGNIAVDTTAETAGNVLLETEIDASSELLALMDDETGTGALVFADTPTLVTPVLGAATATSIAINGATAISSQSGTGGVVIMQGTPTLTTPEIGAATGTSLVLSSTLKSVGATVQGAFNFAADAQGDDDYEIAPSPAITAYATGQQITFTATTANTGACTVDVNALGVKSLKSLHDADPADNYIEAGSVVVAVYDGTNFQIVTPDANP